MKIPTYIGFNPDTKKFFDETGQPKQGGDLAPDIMIGQQKLYNLDLKTVDVDGNLVNYAKIPAGATFEIIVENDYSNPTFSNLDNTSWTNTVGTEYQYTTALSAKPFEIYENNVKMTEGTAGSLAVGEWAWDAGVLKVTVRLSDDADPTSKASGYIQYVESTFTKAFIQVQSTDFNVTNTWYDLTTKTFRDPVPENGEITYTCDASTEDFIDRVGSEPQVTNTNSQLDIKEPGTGESMDVILFQFICRNKYLANPLSPSETTVNVYTKAEIDAKLAGYIPLVLPVTTGNLVQLKADGSLEDAGVVAGNIPTADESAAIQGANSPSASNVFATIAEVTGLFDYRGVYDASGNVYPSTGGSGTAGAILSADAWVISVAGTLGGEDVTAGDLLLALIDTPGQTSTNWNILENNLGYVAEDQANKATDLLTVNDILYPTVKAVSTALGLKQDVFGGIDKTTPVTVDFAPSTGIVTVTAVSGSSFDVCIEDGTAKRYTISSPATFPAIDGTDGIWAFYYDTNGNPVTTQSDIDNYCDLAMTYRVLWNSTLSGDARSVREAYEAHKNTVSCHMHNWMHANSGTINLNGFALASTALPSGVPNISGVNTCVGLTGGTNSDDGLEYTIENSTGGGVWQQDLGEETSASVTSSNAGLFPIPYFAGGLAYELPATRFPFAWDTGTNRPEYIDISGVRQLVTEDYYFIYYLYGFQDPRNSKSVLLASDPVEYASLIDATAANWADIQAAFPIYADEEIRPLHKLLFRYNASPPSGFPVETKYTALLSTEDIRTARVRPTSASGTVLASNVAVAATPTNYTAGSQNVESHLVGVDTALGLKTTGAASSTDNAIVRFDSTTGKLIQNSLIAITDAGKQTFPDIATTGIINATERSTEPSAPASGDIYLDDGTNSASGNPQWRRYTGAVWEDIGGGGSSDIVFNDQTGTTYTLVLTDDDKMVTMSNSSANVMTVPLNASVAYSIGATIAVKQINTGVTTITGDTGVTINGVSGGSTVFSNQYDTGILTYKGSDVWYLDITPEASSNLVIQNAQTGTSYTLVLTDIDKIVTTSNASANTATIPTNASVAYTVGAVLAIQMIGAGVTTVSGDTGVTVNGVSAGSSAMEQYQTITFIKIATNEWLAIGGTFA